MKNFNNKKIKLYYVCQVVRSYFFCCDCSKEDVLNNNVEVNYYSNYYQLFDMIYQFCKLYMSNKIDVRARRFQPHLSPAEIAKNKFN